MHRSSCVSHPHPLSHPSLTHHTGFIIRDDPAAVGEYIANYVAHRITAFAPTPSRKFVLGLPTGSSPIPTYKHLITLVNAGALSFKHVVTFNMDEYVGLPRHHPESYHSFMCVHARCIKCGD
jgi:glucosamine-6-phosphate deaminase